MISANGNKYYVNQEQQRAIIKVLSNNKISMYSAVPDKFPPMRELGMAAYNYDLALLVKVFFETDRDVSTFEMTEAFNGQTFHYGEKSLAITDGNIYFTDTSVNHGDKDFKKLADEYLKRLGNPFSNFSLDNSYESENLTLLEYRQVFKNKVIHSNYVTFELSDVLKVSLSYSSTQGYVGNVRDIVAADEALLYFITDIRGFYPERDIVINRMDLVYYQQERAADASLFLRATPCYRIFINNQAEPFLINAYLNVGAR